MKSKFIFIIAIYSFLQMALTSCKSVKEYQKAYLNDEEMKLEDRKTQIFESNFHSYREGAVGGTNGKAGSGCGCN